MSNGECTSGVSHTHPFDSAEKMGERNIKNNDTVKDSIKNKLEDNIESMKSKNTLEQPIVKNNTYKRPSDSVENRLMSMKKRENDRHRALYIEQLKKEEAMVKAKPEISEGSKRLMAKLYVPLHKRLDRIITEAKKRTEEIRNIRELEKQIKEAQETQSKRRVVTTPKVGRSPRQIFTPNKETTEEIEILNNCTFSPTMNKHSERLFNKINKKKKSVFIRLLDYGILQANLRQKKMEENVPSFTPDLSFTRRRETYNTIMSRSGVNKSLVNSPHGENASVDKLKQMLFMTAKKSK